LNHFSIFIPYTIPIVSAKIHPITIAHQIISTPNEGANK